MIRKVAVSSIMLIFTLFSSVAVEAAYSAGDTGYITTDSVNFRTAPMTDSDIVKTLEKGTLIELKGTLDFGWSLISVSGIDGYVKTEYLSRKLITEDDIVPIPDVELIEWKSVKQFLPLHTDLEVYDIGTGLTYYVRSFSNGNHADVETSTKADTEIMKKTFSNVWKWNPRPVFVTINGRIIAASINGMPHGGGVISNNDMNGQVCIHFLGSHTHNGNKSFEVEHQNALMAAWNQR